MARKNLMQRLKLQGCRTDGLLIAPNGALTFAATNAGGPWSDEQIAAVKRALGRTS